MFALGSAHAIDGRAEHYLDIGKAITSTCHMSYNRTGKGQSAIYTMTLTNLSVVEWVLM